MKQSTPSTVRLECEALEERVTPATLTWLGAVDGLWSQAGNWTTTDVTHPVPQNGDAIVLPAGAANPTQTDDLGSLSLTSITLQGFGYSISGDPIALGGLSAAQPVDTTGSDTITDNVVFDVSAQDATIDLGVAMVNLVLTG